MVESPFALLGLSFGSSREFAALPEDALRSAYRQRARAVHPDRDPSEGAAARFASFGAALESLL
eukprot:318293-Alexandrium_andersonii.AAC.1